MNESWRLFIALELPPDVLKAITRLQDDLKRAIPARAARWVRPEGIHLTLKFLGDVRADRLDELKAAMAEAVTGHPGFELSLEGLGCFPNAERPRVLWVGVTGEIGPLRSLQSDVEKTITPLGFPAEERGFSPHLTLARTARGANREDAAQIGQISIEHDVGLLASWRVRSVSLMRSTLKPDGAEYTQVAESALGS